MDRRELAEAIIEIERPAEPVDRPVRWLLPVVSIAITLAFGLVVLGRSEPPTIGGGDERLGAAEVGDAPVAVTRPGTMDVGQAAPVAQVSGVVQMTQVGQVTERVYLPPPLRLPSDVATLVRRSYHTNVTGLISVEQLEQPGVQHVYELADGRRVILVQLPAGAMDARTLSSYSSTEVVVRGRPASALVSVTRTDLSTLAWDEGPAAYRLWSTTVPIADLAAIAEMLR